MPILFWDASALAKRYFPEVGSETVNALFHAAAGVRMVTTVWGYLETYSILVRRLNSGAIDEPSFNAAVTALQSEVAAHEDFGFLPIEDTTVLASTLLVRRHNLNATDSAILTVLLAYVRQYPVDEPGWALVAADQRLLRAASAEGLVTINPETFRAQQVPQLLSRL